MPNILSKFKAMYQRGLYTKSWNSLPVSTSENVSPFTLIIT